MQPRRDQPLRFLNASLIPVKEALEYRAGLLEDRAATARHDPALGIDPEHARLLRGIAAEFRALADELHYWR